jgi:hypothetical protein
LFWALNIERHVRGLSAADSVSISAACLAKAERASKDDRGMLSDVDVRSGAVAVAASA